MELLPNDIRQHTFRRGMRGFDREEVEQFLEHVAEALEDALNGRREAEDKARRLKGDIERFMKLEESLKEAVVTAQKAMSQAQEASSQETESLKRAAQTEALSIVQDAEAQRVKIEAEIQFLQQLRGNHLQQFRGFLNAQLKTLEQMDSGPDASPAPPAEPKSTPEPVQKMRPMPEPVQPTWEDKPGPLLAEAPTTPATETRNDPQPWQPERIERDDAIESEPVDERVSDEVKPEDAGEAVVAFPPPLVPSEDHRGE